MNALSWLLYLSDVLQSASVALGFGLVAGGIISGVYCMINLIELERMPPGLGKIATAIILGVFVEIVIPSQKTVYMIAASELGQKVAQTDDAKEVFDLLRKRVKDALKDK